MSAKLPPHAPLLISKIKRIQKIHPHWDFKEIVNYIHDKTSHGDPTWPLIDSLYLKLRQMSRGHSMRTNPSPAKRKAISKKIQKLIHEGMSQKQAVAVAMRMLKSKKNPDDEEKNYAENLKAEIEKFISNGDESILLNYLRYRMRERFSRFLGKLSKFIVLVCATQEKYLEKSINNCKSYYDVSQCLEDTKKAYSENLEKLGRAYFSSAEFYAALDIMESSIVDHEYQVKSEKPRRVRSKRKFGKYKKSKK